MHQLIFPFYFSREDHNKDVWFWRIYQIGSVQNSCSFESERTTQHINVLQRDKYFIVSIVKADILADYLTTRSKSQVLRMISTKASRSLTGTVPPVLDLLPPYPDYPHSNCCPNQDDVRGPVVQQRGHARGFPCFSVSCDQKRKVREVVTRYFAAFEKGAK